MLILARIPSFAILPFLKNEKLLLISCLSTPLIMPYDEKALTTKQETLRKQVVTAHPCFFLSTSYIRSTTITVFSEDPELFKKNTTLLLQR